MQTAQFFLTWFDLEQIMKNAITAGLLVFAVVFMAGVLFGWAYGLFIGFTVLLGVALINMGVRK